MPTTTTRLALSKPLGTETVDIGVLNANADKLDAAAGATICTSTTRPSTPYSGQVIYETDTGYYYVYSSGWKLLNPTQSQNYLINGGFEIWQRGTTFTNVADGSHTADRWYVGHNGSGLRTVSQQAFSLGSSPAAGQQGNVFFRYQQTSAGTGSTYSFISQRIEDVRTLSEKVVTVSFWAKADTAGRSFNVYFDRFYGTGGNSPEYGVGGSTTINLTTAWVRYSVTTTLPTLNGKTIGANSYLAFTFDLNKNVAQTIDLWGVQLEEGSVATPFRRNANSIQGELAACQRYYYRIAPGVVSSLIMAGQATTSTQGSMFPMHPVTMRANPTFGFSSLSHFQQHTSGVAISTLTAMTQTSTTPTTAEIATTASSGFRAGDFARIQTSNAAGWVDFSAEL